mmetsp:Transcript_31632/g.69125  ORF Transcript_31632/g.69125 Transcript_31632/m.69125 type:complete len:260 (-) Transcript_31632:85-864(-)
MHGWLQSDDDTEADFDADQSDQLRRPLGSWEGIAYLRESLGPILQGRNTYLALSKSPAIVAEAKGLTTGEWTMVFSTSSPLGGEDEEWRSPPYPMKPPLQPPSPQALWELLSAVNSQALALCAISNLLPYYVRQEAREAGTPPDASPAQAARAPGAAASGEPLDRDATMGEPTVETPEELAILPPHLHTLLTLAFEMAGLARISAVDCASITEALALQMAALEPLEAGQIGADISSALGSELRLLYLAATGIDPLQPQE